MVKALMDLAWSSAPRTYGVRPLAAMPTRMSGVGRVRIGFVGNAEAGGGEVFGAFFGGVFGVLGGVAEGGIAAGDEALNERGRDGEGWRTLGGVEDSEAAAGSCADVEESSALIEAVGDVVDGAGDVGEFGCDRRGDGRILGVDYGEHFESGELVDVLGVWIA